MLIADETGHLFFRKVFGLRGQEVTQKASEKEGTKTIVFFVWSCPSHTPTGLSHGEEEEETVSSHSC